MAKVFYEDDDATFVEVKNLLVGLYRGCPTVTHLRILRAQYERLRAAHPGGVGLLVSMQCYGWVPRFDDAFRKESHLLVSATERGSLGTAYVLTGHGMVTSGLRAFLNGTFLTAGSQEPNRVFTDLVSAAQWMADLPGMEKHWSHQQLVDCGLSFGVGSSALRRTG